MNLLRELAKAKYGVAAHPRGKGSSAPAPPQPNTSITNAENALGTLSQQQIGSYVNTYLPDITSALTAQNGNTQQQIAYDNAQQQNLTNQQNTLLAQQQASNATANTYNNAYQNTYLPEMQQLVSTANNYNSDANFQQQAQLAIGDVNNSYDAANQSQAMAMQQAGVNPSSGAYQGMWNANNINRAAAQAAAATRARVAAQQLGWNMQTQATSLGQTLPGSAAQNTSLGLNAASLGENASALGLNASSLAANTGQLGVSNAMNASTANNQAYQTAGNMTQGIGQLGLGEYNGELQGYNSYNQANSQSSSGLGSALGVIGGIAGTVFGGPVGGMIGSAIGGAIGGGVGGGKGSNQYGFVGDANPYSMNSLDTGSSGGYNFQNPSAGAMTGVGYT